VGGLTAIGHVEDYIRRCSFHSISFEHVYYISKKINYTVLKSRANKML